MAKLALSFVILLSLTSTGGTFTSVHTLVSQVKQLFLSLHPAIELMHWAFPVSPRY